MNIEYITVRMSANVEAVSSLAKGVDDEQARWRPAPGKWSILEVIGHLYDEEQFDFRTRVDYTLNHPGEEWPPLNCAKVQSRTVTAVMPPPPLLTTSAE